MQKLLIMFVISGGLIIGGLGLSIWGNQVIFEDFAKKEAQISTDEGIIIQKSMQQEQNGVFAIDVLEFKEDTIHVMIIDPSGNQIHQKTLDRQTFEGYFDADMSGNYTLMIQNTGQAKMFVTGYIGPEPDATKRTIAFVSIYVLIIGLAGVVISILYSLSRKKTS